MQTYKGPKAFTLVEMLIVIVIIGILASSILPSLMGARDKANDTARISSVNQLNTAIISYSYTTGNYPAVCSGATALAKSNDKYNLNEVRTFLNQIEKIPTDPNQNNTFILNGKSVLGEYGYCSIKKAKNPNSAYILIAKVADLTNANYIVATNNDPVASLGTSDKDYNSFKDLICDHITISTETKPASKMNKSCTLKEGDEGRLRYILLKS